MVDASRLIVGIVLIVVGVLLVVGNLTVAALVPFLGIILIVFGILMLVHVVPGSLLFGIVILALGILLQGNWLDLPRETARFFDIINLVIGIVLIALGALKLLER